MWSERKGSGPSHETPSETYGYGVGGAHTASGHLTLWPCAQRHRARGKNTDEKRAQHCTLTNANETGSLSSSLCLKLVTRLMDVGLLMAPSSASGSRWRTDSWLDRD